jgi:hypothetical protein
MTYRSARGEVRRRGDCAAGDIGIVVRMVDPVNLDAQQPGDRLGVEQRILRGAPGPAAATSRNAEMSRRYCSTASASAAVSASAASVALLQMPPHLGDPCPVRVGLTLTLRPLVGGLRGLLARRATLILDSWQPTRGWNRRSANRTSRPAAPTPSPSAAGCRHGRRRTRAYHTTRRLTERKRLAIAPRLR